MRIFKQQAKSTAPFMLEFTKADSRRLQHDPMIKQIIDELGTQERLARSIRQQLPLMTLNTVCQLFQALRVNLSSSETSLVFETITVLRREAAGQHFKYEPYVHIKQFTLDRHYRDFTGEVVKCLFTASEFADSSYENKQAWATDFITAYQAANPSQIVVALVPTVAEADAPDFQVRYAGLDTVAKPAKTTPADPSRSDVPAETTSEASQSKAAASAAPVPTEKKVPAGPKPAKTAQPAKQKQGPTAVSQPQQPPIEPRVGQIKVPQFKVTNLAAVPEHDPQYVTYQVEQKKRHSNTYLKTLEQRLNANATQDLVSYSEQQRQAMTKALREYQAQHDPQANLHDEVQAQMRQAEAIAETKQLAALKASCEADVKKIQSDAQRAVEQRQTEYAHQVEEAQTALTAEYAKRSNEQLATELKARQQALKGQLSQLKTELTQQTRAAYNSRVGQLVEHNQDVAGTVYQNLAKKIDAYALEVTKVHLNAVEIQASAERAKRNLADVTQLEQQLDRASADKQKLQQEKADLQHLLQGQTTELTQLKQTQTAPTSSASSQIEQLLALQLAANRQAAQGTATAATTPIKPSPLKKMSLGIGTALGLVVLGGGGMWTYQEHQQVSQALASNQQQLRQAQSNTASLNRQYYQLSQRNTALKGQASAAQQDKKAAQAEASQTKAQLTKAQATAKSAAKKTSEK